MIESDFLYLPTRDYRSNIGGPVRKFNPCVLVVMMVVNLLFDNSFAQTEAAAEGSGGEASAPATPPLSITYLSKTGNLQQAKTASALAACTSNANIARTACTLGLSPKLQTAGAVIGGILGAVKSMRSTSEACEKTNKAMDIAQKAIAAYNAACGAAMLYCESTCEKAQMALSADLKIFNSRLPPLQGAVGAGDVTASDEILLLQKDIGMSSSKNPEVGVVLKTCENYKLNLAAAGTALVGMIQQSSLSAGCVKDTTVDCSKDKYNTACRTVVDCGKSENANQTYCVCQRTPNAAGCSGSGSGSSFAQGTGAGSNGAIEGSSRGDGSYSPSSDSSIAVQTTASKLSASGSSSAKGSGSSASLGGDSSGSGGNSGSMGSGSQKTSGTDVQKAKGLNTNILSGYDSGGGGGFGGSSIRSTASQDSQYRAYIPGGSKSALPNSGSLGSSKEVTASGAKSNWEKISEMYSSKQSSFLGK